MNEIFALGVVLVLPLEQKKKKKCIEISLGLLREEGSNLI